MHRSRHATHGNRSVANGRRPHFTGIGRGASRSLRRVPAFVASLLLVAGTAHAVGSDSESALVSDSDSGRAARTATAMTGGAVAAIEEHIQSNGIGLAYAAGEDALAVGSDAAAQGDYATTVGGSGSAYGSGAAAFGNGAGALADDATAMGFNATADGEGATATGSGSRASGIHATAVGRDSLATGNGSIALGGGAHSQADDSVALGNASISDRAGSVSVGRGGQERQIVHVAAGTAGTDAVNKGQMDAGLADARMHAEAAGIQPEANANAYTDVAATRTLARANAYTDARFAAWNDDFTRFQGDVERRFRAQDRRMDRQGAMSAAMLNMATSAAGIHTDNRIGVGLGFQGGERALSVGYQRAFGERATVSLGGALSGDERSVGMGAGFGW